MAHCRSEMLESNTSRVSSQVVGDSTAQTVMTKSIGFMPEIPQVALSNEYHIQIRRSAGLVSRQREGSRKSPPASLKTDAEHQPGLVALEIDEIDRCRRGGRPPPSLDAPGRRQPRALRELEVGNRADEERLPRKILQADAVIIPEIAGFAAEQDVRMHLHHGAERRADRGLLHCSPRRCEAGPFRLVDEIERGNRHIRHQLTLKDSRDIRAVIAR